VATIDDDTAVVVDSLTPGATYAFRVVYLPAGTSPDDEEKDEKKDTEEGVAEAVKEAWSSAATATATRTDDQSPTPTPPSIDLALEDPELMFCGATAGEFIFSFVRAIRLMMSCFGVQVLSRAARYSWTAPRFQPSRRPGAVWNVPERWDATLGRTARTTTNGAPTRASAGSAG
jgi:hypothetical protein